MRRTAALAFGVTSYAIFFVTFLYLVGFVSNLIVPKSIDSGTAGPLGSAMLVNTLLLLVFGVQHSVMARPGFKAWWTQYVPRPIERSVYTLASSLALIALFVFWQPIPQTVWAAEGALATALRAGLFLGVGLVLFSTFLIDHFDLFGLRQVWLYFRGVPYAEKRFSTPLLYQWIRHPLYVGWFMTFWITPSMSAGHLLFSLVMTSYVLIALPLEERDLLHALGEPYRRWRERTPLFVPRARAAASRPAGTAASRPARTAESH
jgi:protein-S-isoprenylcysteine O-methyltransferase Ste14